MDYSEDFTNDMLLIVNAFFEVPESEAFRVPVDPILLGIPDYPQVVKHPMDLGTVKSQLLEGVYQDVTEVAADIRQVWQNCMLYNQDGSYLYQVAETFALVFEQQYEDYQRKRFGIATLVDMDRIPSLENKSFFSRQIYSKPASVIADILTYLHEHCPQSVESTPDQVQLNIDAIPPKHFWQVFSRLLKASDLGGSEAESKEGQEET